MHHSLTTLIVSALLLKGGIAAAEDCSSYPFMPGIDVQTIQNFEMPKIISTSRAIPFSDDIADVDDAISEATLVAKSEIAKFMSEAVVSSEAREKMIERMALQQSGNREAVSKTVELITKTFSSNSQAMLRGVVHLGDCYTPNREVRVTVGIKPETLAQSTGLSQALNKAESASKEATGSGAQSISGKNASTQDSTNRQTPGFSNTRKLNDF